MVRITLKHTVAYTLEILHTRRPYRFNLYNTIASGKVRLRYFPEYKKVLFRIHVVKPLQSGTVKNPGKVGTVDVIGPGFVSSEEEN